MRLLFIAVLTFLMLTARHAAAQDEGPIHAAIANVAGATALTASTTAGADGAQSPAPRHVAFEYSDGYKTRAKIHKYAAFATLPLFASEFYLGQSIYNTPSDSKKNAHIAIGTGILGLYGAQAVTGVWNLVEANKDPNGHKRRLIHGILMLASGAGFAITPMTAPGRRDRLEFGTSSASTHRAVAYTSIGIGTAGYLMMLFGGYVTLMPAFVSHIVGSWAALYSGSAILRTIVSFVHVAGLVGGGGAAVSADRATLKATRAHVPVTREQIDAIHNTHRVVIIGLAGVIVSGVLLFAADVATYAPSKLFWLKMLMIAALMINGAFLVRVGHGVTVPNERTRRTMRWTAALSLALWFLTTLVGAGLPNI